MTLSFLGRHVLPVTLILLLVTAVEAQPREPVQFEIQRIQIDYEKAPGAGEVAPATVALRASADGTLPDGLRMTINEVDVRLRMGEDGTYQGEGSQPGPTDLQTIALRPGGRDGQTLRFELPEIRESQGRFEGGGETNGIKIYIRGRLIPPIIIIDIET